VLREADVPITTDAVIDEDKIPGVAERQAAANAGLLDDEPEQMPIIIPAEVGKVNAATPEEDDGIIAAGVLQGTMGESNSIANVPEGEIKWGR
jgi:hypothetical protein